MAWRSKVASTGRPCGDPINGTPGMTYTRSGLCNFEFCNYVTSTGGSGTFQLETRLGDFCSTPGAPCPEAGAAAGRYSMDYSKAAGLLDFYLCVSNPITPTPATNGCVVKVVPDIGYPAPTINQAGRWEKAGPGTYTAATCDPTTIVPSAGSGPSTPTTATSTSSISNQSTSTASVTPCPSGQYPGQVNGVDVCVPGSTSPGSVVTKSGSGSTKTDQTASGMTTENKTTSTTCEGTSCTSVTVTVTASGSGTTTSTSTATVTRGEFCKSNAKDPNCGGLEGSESSFGGSCNPGFSCTGDAAMCAAAKAVNDQNCSFSLSAAESDVYEANKGTPTASVTGSLPGSGTVTIGPTSFDSTDAIGGAQGMDDVVIPIAGTSFTVEFSRVNVWLERLGALLVAVAFLLALRIVTRG